MLALWDNVKKRFLDFYQGVCYNFNDFFDRSVSMDKFNELIKIIDEYVWGLPLIILIMACGILLTVRLGFVQVRKLGKALKYMVRNEETGSGEVSSFAALCTALSATVGTGNIVGVATAVATGGPGALFWMEVAAFFGMATKYAEGLLAVKYRIKDENGSFLGGPFYYIENGLGRKWKWLAKLFALFGLLAGLMGIGTITQINGITTAANNFFDPRGKAYRIRSRNGLHCYNNTCRNAYHPAHRSHNYRRYQAYRHSFGNSCTGNDTGLRGMLSADNFPSRL